jgi:hypothetical protein
MNSNQRMPRALLLWADAHEADLSAAGDRYDAANHDRA